MNHDVSDVYLLGAGFARAISPQMPLLQEIADRLQSTNGSQPAIPSEVKRMMSHNFAHALSYLEQGKPWLTEADNLRHRALFLDLSSAMARDLERVSKLASDSVGKSSPPWLSQLIRHWHAHRSTVLTLNYDTLIESVAAAIKLEQGGCIDAQDIYPQSLTDAAARSGRMTTAARKASFRLLKLHGSTNWYYSGRSSAFGEPIYFVPPLVEKRATDADRRAHQHRLRAVADKYPLLIPPVYDKSPLLTHETIRALWFDAGESLKHARRVICMGYSLPESDLTMNHFLRTTCAPEAEFLIVDPSNDVPARFTELFSGTRVQVESFTDGDESIPRFVERELARARAPTSRPLQKR